MIATWEDGSTWRIAGLSVKAWNEMMADNKKRGALYDGKNKNGARIYVTIYHRHQVKHLAMWEEQQVDKKDKMVIQLVVREGYKGEEELFIDFGKRYARGEVDKNTLEKEKAEF
eukprot:5490029-Pyramimonas_sp.AAC.1